MNALNFSRFINVLLCAALLTAVAGCYAPNSPCVNCDEDDNDHGTEFVSIDCKAYFPYQSTDAWWHYSESGANSLKISVTDTISDDQTGYFKVSFAEQRIDTTTDWFKSTSEGILFSSSLIGEYRLFLPKRLTNKNGSFTAGDSEVSYRYYPTRTIGGVSYDDVLALDYATPFLHNFDVIELAKGIGIVSLTDRGGRFDVTYVLDSTSVGDL